MKTKKIEMKRAEWEHLTEYKKAPIQKRYLELLASFEDTDDLID